MSWSRRETSFWRPRVEDLRRLETAKGRKELGGFCAEGWRVIKRGWNGGYRPSYIVTSAGCASAPKDEEKALLEELAASSVPIHVAPDDVISDLIGGRSFGSLVAFFEALPEADLLSAAADRQRPCKILVLVEAQDPGNIGALMRTALASGVEALVLIRGTDPWHPKAVRASMGSLFHLPIVRLTGEMAFLQTLADLQIQSIGALVEGGYPPSLRPAAPRHALWMGSEAHGLPPAICEALDLRWSIPMRSLVDSFSINAATAILLYETYREDTLQIQTPVSRSEQMARFRGGASPPTPPGKGFETP